MQAARPLAELTPISGFIAEAVDRARRAGAGKPVTVRASGGFWSCRLAETL